MRSASEPHPGGNERQLFRQTYRPSAPVRLPRWAVELWRWL
jgi:hypothetical protein